MVTSDRMKSLEFAHQQFLVTQSNFPFEPKSVINLAREYEAYLDGSGDRKERYEQVTVTAARAAHEAIRTLQIENNEPNVASPWESVSKDIKESCYIGVERVRENPDVTNEELHNSWIKTKESQGWKYGEVRSEEDKLHPCMVPYNELPQFQKLKDAMFRNVVKAVLWL